MSEVKGEIKILYTEGKVQFILDVPSRKLLNSKEAWEIFGRIAKTELPLNQVLRSMADMLEAL